jgi:hypothetical protein
LVFRRIAALCARFGGDFDDVVDFGHFEADLADIELQVDEALQFDRQRFPVPARLFRQPVVSDDVGALFHFAQVRQLQEGTSSKPSSLAARVKPRTFGRYSAVLASKNRRPRLEENPKIPVFG